MANIKHQTQQNEAMKTMGIGGQSLASREKYWRELKPAERIERLRRFVHNLQAENRDLRIELLAVKKHTHDKDGQPVVVQKLTEYYPLGNQLGSVLTPHSEDFYI